MRIIRIHQGKTLPVAFRVTITMILGVLIVVTMEQLRTPYSIGLSILLSTLVPAFWFAAEILIIDLESNEIFNGTWIMGFKFGKVSPITSIDKIFINRVKTKQTIYSLANNKNISTHHEYRAFLKLATGEKFFMVSHPDKRRIVEKCQQAISKLGLSAELLVLPD